MEEQEKSQSFYKIRISLLERIIAFITGKRLMTQDELDASIERNDRIQRITTPPNDPKNDEQYYIFIAEYFDRHPNVTYEQAQNECIKIHPDWWYNPHY